MYGFSNQTIKMRIKYYWIIFTFIIFTTTISQSCYATDKVKTVVVFFPLDVNLPAYQGFLAGLNGRFSETPDQPYNLILEYMDNNKFQDETHVQYMVDLYNEKYKLVDIDLIITFGPGAYPLLKKYNFRAISNTPIINIDLESIIASISTDSSFKDDNVVHIPISPNYEKTFRTAINLFPDNKDIYIVSGHSPTDEYFAQLALSAAHKFKDSHNIVSVNQISLDSTLAVVKTISSNSIVFVTSYIEDSRNVPYSTFMVLRMISNQCKAPLFTLSDDFIDAGAIGGYVYSFIAVGKRVGEILEDLLGGTSLTKITINADSFNKHMYDWQLLKKWNLNNSKIIPSNSDFFNKDEDFFDKYKWYIIGVISFLIGQTLLIMFLIDLNRRHKAVAKQQAKNEEIYREIVREDRLSMMSELTASLSHELNQPLTAILYNAQAGKHFLENGNLNDNQANEIFDNIIEDDKRAGSLISSVRSMMKLENREKDEINLGTLIQQTIKLFHSESIAQHIKISFKLIDVPILVFGDKIQLQQVILNLLFNAAIAMENDNIENRKIEIIQQIGKEFVTISICDSGPGFDKSLEENLFKPFVTTRTEGLGIGLAISKSIIEEHNGEIMAQNQPEGGAKFSFNLPIV